MGTKLKTIWTDQKFKFVCSFLAVTFITISFGALFEAYWFNWDYMANTNNYLESDELESKVLNAYDNIDQVYNFYKNEENIRAGNAIKSEDIEAFKLNKLIALGIENPEDVGFTTEQEMLNDSSFWEPYAAELDAEKKRLINEGLYQYERLKKELAQTQGLSYIIDSKGIKNSQPNEVSQDDLLNRRVTFTYNKGAITSSLPNIDQFEPLGYAVESDFQVNIGFDDAYIAEREIVYQAERWQFLSLVTISIVFFILAAIFACWHVFTAGRKKMWSVFNCCRWMRFGSMPTF